MSFELGLDLSLSRIATSLSKSLFLPFFVQCLLEIRFSLNKGPLSHSTLSLSLSLSLSPSSSVSHSLLLTLLATSNIFCPGRVCVILPWLNLLFVLKRKRIGILSPMASTMSDLKIKPLMSHELSQITLSSGWSHLVTYLLAAIKM